MNRKFLAVIGILALLVVLIPAATAGAGKDVPNLPIPVDISHRLKDRPIPAQPYLDGVHLPSGGTTTDAQCYGGPDETLVITIPSFDPANPGNQDVVFWKESVGGSATIWVAWDYLVTHYGRQDVITCGMISYLQGSMDSIVDTDVYYFGDYVERPTGNTKIDVMIYNIVDESFFDPTFPFYIAGFFWGGLNQAFDQNMIFIDSLDWVNRLGPNTSPWRGSDPSLWREYLYEGTVAHELEHLIHNDHDPDEDSWIDEGMADLAEYLNGFGHPDGHVVYYLAFHRTSLTVWGGGLEDYGASYLFQLYLLENFGNKGCTESVCPTGWDNSWTMTEIDEQANSIAGVENATGEVFNDLYDAWILANFVDDPSLSGAGGFPLGYDEISLTPFVSDSYSPWSIERAITDIYGSDHHGNLPISRYYGGYVSGTVEWPQGELPPYTPWYGSYKGIQPRMNIQLIGAAQSGVAPYTGTYEAASDGGHLLTDRTLALLPAQDTLAGGFTLDFATWYDIEEEWDYGFVEVSEDGGLNWYPISDNITTCSNNPNSSTAWANALGAAASSCAVITGNSGGWVNASFALPADDDLMIRFNYYTDEAVNGQGWFIDDVSVNGFSDGFESGDGNWSLGGWSITTGLFGNDWLAAYVNPVHKKGKFDYLDYGYFDVSTLVRGGLYELEHGTVDTSKLQNKAATVVIANRPGENPFSTFYQLLVNK